MSLLSCEKSFNLPFSNAESIEHYALSNNTILIVTENWEYVLWDGLREMTISQGKFPENKDHSGICSIYSYWFSHINNEKIIYFSQTDNCLKIWDLTNPDSNQKAESYPGRIEIKEEFNFFMWVHYIRETGKVLILHMVSFERVVQIEVDKEGVQREIAQVDIKNVNCVHVQGDQFYFASNVEDNMPIYIASVDGIKKIQFEIKSDVTQIEFGFLKEDLMFLLYNANEVADTGAFLINIGAYDLNSNPKIIEDEDGVQKVVQHDESDPVQLDGQVLVDKMMQAIAVTTTENNLILHKINLNSDGKYTSKKEDSLEMKESPTNFSLSKDSLIYCEKDENGKVDIAFYRSTDVRCLYMWLLTNVKQLKDEKGNYQYMPGDLNGIVDQLV